MPVVPLLGGLGLAVIVDRGGGERIVAIANRDIAPFVNCSGVVNGCQASATGKRIIANTRHTIWNGDTRQAGAILESRIANARHAVGDRDARQTGATVERRRSDARHAIGTMVA